MTDVRSVPLPPEILEIARLRRKELIDPVTGKVDPKRVQLLVESIDPKVRKSIYEGFEELKRRRSEERSRYYEPLDETGNPPSDQKKFHLSNSKIRLCFGGNQCLGGEQEIYDPVKDKWRAIGGITKPFHVYAYDGTKAVVAEASRPFEKASAPLYYMFLSNGHKIVCSLSHRMLTTEGWKTLDQILGSETMALVRPDSRVPINVSHVVYLRTDTVWDITVPNFQNYIIHGVINHNSGKTECLVEEFNWLATGRHPFRRTWHPPVKLRMSSPSWKSHGKITIPKMKEVICREDLVGNSWDSAFSTNLNAVEESMTLKYKNGSTWDLMTYDQKPIQHAGVQLHAAGFDEEPPEPIYNETIPRLSRYNGCMVFAMTPVEGWTWVADKLVYANNPDVEVFYLPTFANKHLDKASLEFLARQYAGDPEQAAIRLWGEIINIGGMVFKTLRNELHVCPDFKIPVHWKKGIFIDPAPSKSHAASWVAIDPRTIHQPSGKHKRYVYRELIFTEGSEISSFCREVRDHNEGDWIDFFEMDPHWDWDNKAAGGLNIFKEFKKHIPNLKPAIENMGDIYEETIRELLKPDLMATDDNARVGLQIFESCPVTLRQLRLLSYERLDQIKSQNRDKPRVRKVKNDLVDTLGMSSVSKRFNNPFGSSDGFDSEPDYQRDEYGRITG